MLINACGILDINQLPFVSNWNGFVSISGNCPTVPTKKEIQAHVPLESYLLSFISAAVADTASGLIGGETAHGVGSLEPSDHLDRL